MTGERFIVPKSWRSEWPLLCTLVGTGLFSVSLSNFFRSSLLTGELFKIASTTVSLRLPVFWLAPCFFAFLLLYRVFNVRFILSGRSVEARYGVLSLRQKVSRVRYEDIRSLEVSQSVIGRVLGFGNVDIGTSGTSGVEIVLLGVLAPRKVQEWIQFERDRWQSAPDSREAERLENRSDAVGEL